MSPRIAYLDKHPSAASLHVIDQANEILETYSAEGFDLTLRQLYYQFVARGLIENTDRSYKRLGSIVNDARLTGLIDWEHIVDRTRAVRALTHWRDTHAIIGATEHSFHTDMWATQPVHVEAWVEKDALVDVVARACEAFDVPYLSCRGYTSQSEMWTAARRMLDPLIDGRTVVVLHLGDHDPSGIDMTRDIDNRLWGFVSRDYLRPYLEDGYEAGELRGRAAELREHFAVRRIALNRDQIRAYDPPPNPAKVTDSRWGAYVEAHGHQSWELDALEPRVLSELVQDHIRDLIGDSAAWQRATERQASARALLARAHERWDEIEELLAN